MHLRIHPEMDGGTNLSFHSESFKSEILFFSFLSAKTATRNYFYFKYFLNALCHHSLSFFFFYFFCFKIFLQKKNTNFIWTNLFREQENWILLTKRKKLRQTLNKNKLVFFSLLEIRFGICSTVAPNQHPSPKFALKIGKSILRL